jgi:7,8-dihydropterin-6-yl-methyl-4-(beta-D-ribofuranosyl)aminobenzene 5'-phosphate synthase
MRVLFDTGQNGDTLMNNAAMADIDLHGLDAILLSHGHYDHTGVLMSALMINKDIQIIVHPSAFQEKYSRTKEGLRSIGIPFTMDNIKQHCRIIDGTSPVSLGGMTTTGAIKRLTLFEEPQQDLLYKWRGAIYTDPLNDDQSLVINADGRLILLCGCCHAGIVNTVEQVRRQHGKYPELVAGGLHLARASPEQIALTAAKLGETGIKQVIAGHCSGDHIAEEFSSRGIMVTSLHAGMRIL